MVMVVRPRMLPMQWCGPTANEKNPFRLAMDVETQRIGKHVGIVVGRERRRPHYHALADFRAAHRGVAGGDAREREVAVAGDAQAFLDGVRNKRRIADQLRPLIVVRIEGIERAAGRAAGGGERPEQSEDHAEQLLIVQPVALIARHHEIGEEVGPRIGAAVGDDRVGEVMRLLEDALAFHRIGLSRLGGGGHRYHVLVVEQDPLLGLVEPHHGGDERPDHKPRAILAHRVERRAVALDVVEHAFDDTGDVRLDLRHAARGKRRHQQPAKPGVPLAVHLGHELDAHELVVLLVAGSARQLRGEPLGVRKHLVDVGVTPDDHLRRTVAENIERRPPRPAGHMAVGVFLEFTAAKIEFDDVVAVQFSECGHHSSRSHRHPT